MSMKKIECNGVGDNDGFFEIEKHSESELSDLLYGGKYNFKHQHERLNYIGKHKGWHRFEKIGCQGVWCELLDSDLHMIEKTIDT